MYLAAADDEIVTRVKGYIDAGTCGSISANSNCGTSASSYYKEITYNSKRVIISSQVPDHSAEEDSIISNPNTRCERYQYIQLPLTPTKVTRDRLTKESKCCFREVVPRQPEWELLALQ